MDYHEKLGTKINYDKNGDPWIDPELWDKTKAEYCQREKITLHIDDSPVYGKHFKTPFGLFFSGEGPYPYSETDPFMEKA